MKEIKAMDLSELFSNDLDETHMLSGIYQYAIKNNYATAIWRLPQESKIHLIIDFSDNLNKVKTDLEELGEGFIFSPFYDQEEEQSILIKNHLQYQSNQKTLLLSSDLPSSIAYEAVVSELKAGLISQEECAHYSCGPTHLPTSTSKEDYIGIVEKSIEKIKDGEFQKVVPARIEVIDIPKNFEVIAAFEKLCDLYPEALVSLISIPSLGTWMGATPEMLISSDKEGQFRTVALAGTQPLEEDADLSEVAWKQKEIEEQAMVSRYIINCFKKIRLREFVENGPRTARAGKLAHLKTDFEVDTNSVNFPQLGTVMLDLLHPTSAVCGMPATQAKEFLLRHENFDRQFFSGYLGPINMSYGARIFVNIRCVQLLKNQAILYAGAGVTGNSSAEKEWEETIFKLQTMKRIF